MSCAFGNGTKEHTYIYRVNLNYSIGAVSDGIYLLANILALDDIVSSK